MRNTPGEVQAAFGTVLWIVCGLGVVIAIATLLMSGRTWEDFGKGRMVLDRDDAPRSSPGAAATAERDDEIRQMLEARNSRRARRGEPPLDVEAELARLTGPKIDNELRGEIRDLVIARNKRRERRGQPLLDVEAEIEREIVSLREL